MSDVNPVSSAEDRRRWHILGVIGIALGREGPYALPYCIEYCVRCWTWLMKKIHARKWI